MMSNLENLLTLYSGQRKLSRIPENFTPIRTLYYLICIFSVMSRIFVFD